jgi:hypothetical protein
MVRRPQRHATVTWRLKSQATRVGTHPPADRDAGVARDGEPSPDTTEAGWLHQLLTGGLPPPGATLHRGLVPHG